MLSGNVYTAHLEKLLFFLHMKTSQWSTKKNKKTLDSREVKEVRDKKRKMADTSSVFADLSKR